MSQTKVQQNQLDPNLQFGGGGGGGPSIFEVGSISAGSPAIYNATLVDVSSGDLGSPTTATRVLVFVNGVNQVQEVDFNYDYALNKITFAGGSPTSIPLPGDQLVLMTIGGSAGATGGGSPIDTTIVRMDLGSPVTRTNEGTLRISGSPVTTVHTDFYQDADLNIIGTGAISLGYSGLERLQTAADGRVRILGDSLVDSSRRLIEFTHQNGISVRGHVGYDNSTILRLSNLIHGQSVVVEAEDAGGVDRQFLIGDPDDLTEIRGRTTLELYVGDSGSSGSSALLATGGAGVDLYHLGSPNVIVGRTVSLASGGLEVNNTVTGAGFERVLTTSDLGGGASPVFWTFVENGGTTGTGRPVPNDTLTTIDNTIAAGSPGTLILSGSPPLQFRHWYIHQSSGSPSLWNPTLGRFDFSRFGSPIPFTFPLLVQIDLAVQWGDGGAHPTASPDNATGLRTIQTTFGGPQAATQPSGFSSPNYTTRQTSSIVRKVNSPTSITMLARQDSGSTIDIHNSHFGMTILAEDV